MVRRALLVLCLAFFTLWMAGCGQTYKLESITASPSTGFDLTSPGQTGQLTVTAKFSNTKTSDVTSQASYNIDSPSVCTNEKLQCTDPSSFVGNQPVLSFNKSGVIQASSSVPGCTWVAVTQNGQTTYIHDPFTVVITYTNNGITSQTTVPVTIETATNCTGQ